MNTFSLKVAQFNLLVERLCSAGSQRFDYVSRLQTPVMENLTRVLHKRNPAALINFITSSTGWYRQQRAMGPASFLTSCYNPLTYDH